MIAKPALLSCLRRQMPQRLRVALWLGLFSTLAAAQSTDGGSFVVPGSNTANRQGSADRNDTSPARPDARATPRPDARDGAQFPGSQQRDQTPGARTRTDNQFVVPRPRVQAPAPPSEFQKYVETATGRLLPMFGVQFFADAAEGFAPVDNIPVGADYVVAPGDEVIVRAWGSIDIDYRTTVDRNGMVNLPKVGSFTVAGVTGGRTLQSVGTRHLQSAHFRPAEWV